MLSVNSSGHHFLWQEGGSWAERTTGMHVKKSRPTQEIKLCSKLIYLVRTVYIYLKAVYLGNIFRSVKTSVILINVIWLFIIDFFGGGREFQPNLAHNFSFI